MILAIQSTYTNVDLGIYKDSQLLKCAHIDKKNACATLIPTIDTLLKKNGASLSDVQYMIVNQGPGPFTSLRTVIATVNGIAFATKIPLLGVNALEVMMHEYDPQNKKTVLILLNAYGNEYYYGFKKRQSIITVGVCSLNTLPIYTGNDMVHVIGHTTGIVAENLHQYTHSTSNSDRHYAKLETLVQYGMLFHAKIPLSKRLLPLYIKNHF